MGIENRNSKKFQKTGSSNPSVTRKNTANNRGGDSSQRNSNFKVSDNSRSRAKGAKVTVNKGNNKQSKSGTQKRNNRFNNDNITYNNNNTNKNGKRVNNNQNKKLGNGSKNTPSNSHSVNNQKNNQRKRPKAPIETMRVMPLGGLKEIGKNITLVEYRDDILIIDCGFSFPEDEMFGIDVVIPDFTYLKENMERIKGLIITHGHEDHIGGVPFLLKEINVPVYAPPLAMGLIRNKLKEHGLAMEEHVIEAGDIFNVGAFRVEAIHTNHSIADAMAYSIKCPGGHLVHTGDFKIDYSPLDGKRIDLAKFAQLGQEGVDVLLCDSTNVLRPGYTPSERVVVDSMNEIFAKTEKRLIIATFSSNIYRIKYFMEASIKYGRKIAISGRSMENVLTLARELGYVNLPESAFVDIRKIGNIPDANITIITTGSQGEPMSALTRMANDSHRAVKLKSGDTVVFSSSPIPGNAKAVTNIVNKLYEKKVNVFLSDFVDIHVSGHACKEELKLIHSLVKPRFFIPAHGEYRHLREHARLAESMGMDRGNIFVMNNGDALRITGKQAKVEPDAAPAEDVLVDGYGVGDVGNVVLRDRKQLSESGLIVIAVSIDSNSGLLAARPELITRGFIYVKENMPLINEATEVVYESIDKWNNLGSEDINALKNIIKDDMRGFIYKKTRRSPVILPVIMDI
ncbi:ribonuclease J [Mogibacterium diversum]|uniref:ribonuclease J n=1 Tax=Mogibacterium diversum TaxID=114527 RepID=UPI002F423AD9